MIAIVRTRTLRALRADLAYTESCNATERAETDRQARAAELATDSVIRAEATIETLRTALAEAQADAAGARGALAVLETQHQLDTEDRVALRMLLRATRRQHDRMGRVFVLLRFGRLHSVHATQDAAESTAEAEGAPREGWTSTAPGAALPPASEVAWRVQPLPLGGAA
ncbi:hypothetical protein [Streptomyces sp. NPDC088726]|uniref:hypothetical protein n=1 Tax=Streptomyces sp. NPDC088726 TaxID=3365874 RepID=UPI00382225FD